jgi:3-methyladenine DNA glycosylase AlkD
MIKGHALEASKSILEPHRDAAKAAPMAKYMRDQFAYLGIPSPQRKALSRELFQTLGLLKEPIDAQLVHDLWNHPEREYQYVALDYLDRQRKKLSPAHADLLEHCVTNKSWWDTIDSLSHVAGALVRLHPVTLKRIEEWSSVENFWLRRIAILHQLSFKRDTDEARLFKYVLENAHDTEFFIRKAIGWALREYSYTSPDAVQKFVRDHAQELSNLSKREALKALERKRKA